MAVSSRRASVPEPARLCCNFRSTTDALRLYTPVRPYRIQSRLVSSRSFDNGRPPARHSRASLQIEVTAFDAWNCRADVACVGADLRVRPQNRQRSGEDGRTHRSAPTVGAPPRRAVHPKRSRPSFRNEKKLGVKVKMGGKVPL